VFVLAELCPGKPQVGNRFPNNDSRSNEGRSKLSPRSRLRLAAIKPGLMAGKVAKATTEFVEVIVVSSSDSSDVGITMSSTSCARSRLDVRRGPLLVCVKLWPGVVDADT
jgi:hypothetical protein